MRLDNKLYGHFNRNFCSKHSTGETKAHEDKEVIVKRHESAINKRLNKLMRREIIPILVLTWLGITCYVFYDQILNLFDISRCSPGEIKYISDKVSDLVKMSKYGKIIDQDRIETELVEEAYSYILECLQIKAFSNDVTMFESDAPEIFLFPNGDLMLSDTLLNQVTDLRQLLFMIIRWLQIVRMQFLRQNLAQKVKYGDFRRQLFYFKAKYTGYDALFIDYLTNMRYTLDQIMMADTR